MRKKKIPPEVAEVTQQIKEAHYFIAQHLPRIEENVAAGVRSGNGGFSREELKLWYGLDQIEKALERAKSAADARVVLYYLQRACDIIHIKRIPVVPGGVTRTMGLAERGGQWTETQVKAGFLRHRARQKTHNQWRKWQAQEKAENPKFGTLNKSEQARRLKKKYQIHSTEGTIRKRLI